MPPVESTYPRSAPQRSTPKRERLMQVWPLCLLHLLYSPPAQVLYLHPLRAKQRPRATSFQHVMMAWHWGPLTLSSQKHTNRRLLGQSPRSLYTSQLLPHLLIPHQCASWTGLDSFPFRSTKLHSFSIVRSTFILLFLIYRYRSI